MSDVVPSLYQFKGGVERKTTAGGGDLSLDFQNKQYFGEWRGRELFSDEAVALRFRNRTKLGMLWTVPSGGIKEA